MFSLDIYRAMHKGFKCLEPNSGRVYVSRDVVFDELVFPFSKLHPNAGSRLCQEILLLPPDMRNNLSLDHGGELCIDQMTNVNPNFSVDNGVQDNGETTENGVQYVPVPSKISGDTATGVHSESDLQHRVTDSNLRTDSLVQTMSVPAPVTITSTMSAPHSPAPQSPTASSDSSEVTGAPMAPPIVSVSPIQQQRPRTRLQSGIVKPKIITDGTIRYGKHGLFSSAG